MTSRCRSESDARSRRKLRLLLIVEASAAGTGRHVCDLIQGLLADGHDVHLIYSTTRMDKLFKQRIEGMPALKRTAMQMRSGLHPSDFPVLRKIRRYARENGPFDVIHGHSSKGGAMARLSAIGTASHAFYTIHGLAIMDPSMRWWKRLFYQQIERLLSFVTWRIISVSPEEAEAAGRLGLGRARITTIPNGIEPMQLKPREEARKAIGVEGDVPVIGFVGRLVPVKAADVLLNSFALAAKTVPQARLAIVGGGPLEASLRELSCRLGISEKVIWLGPCDAREVFAAFDIFALSSLKEGLPYVVLEAMVSGKPIVATDTSAVSILVEHGVSGFIVRCGDVMGFADSLIALASDRGRREEFGRASAAMSKLFTIDAMVSSTLREYFSTVPSSETTPEQVQLPKAETPLTAIKT